MAHALPHRAPRFPLSVLRRVCTSKRMGPLSKQHFGLVTNCLLSCRSRKIGLALPSLTKWRSSVAAGSDIFLVVYPSRMNETSSSMPERISSSSGSMTNGMPATGWSSCSKTCFRKKPRTLCRVALEYGCQDDCGVEVDQEEVAVNPCKDSTHRVHVGECHSGCNRNSLASEPTTVRIRFHFHRWTHESDERRSVGYTMGAPRPRTGVFPAILQFLN